LFCSGGVGWGVMGFVTFRCGSCGVIWFVHFGCVKAVKVRQVRIRSVPLGYVTLSYGSWGEVRYVMLVCDKFRQLSCCM
jgi:hypothetical protein